MVTESAQAEQSVGRVLAQHFPLFKSYPVAHLAQLERVSLSQSMQLGIALMLQQYEL